MTSEQIVPPISGMPHFITPNSFNIFLNCVLKDQMQTCFFLPLLRFVIIYFCVRSFCHDPEILLEKTKLLLFSL